MFEPPLGAGAQGGNGNSDVDARAAADATETGGRLQILQHCLVATCTMQASSALFEMTLLNDPMSGFMGCGLAALGMQAASPTGFKFLPSYMVLAFCNGTMKVLLSLEMYNYGHVLGAVMGPFGLVKIAGIVVLTSPFMIFGGLALAWELHCELRGLALRAGASHLSWASPPAGTIAQSQQAQSTQQPLQAPAEAVDGLAGGGAIGAPTPPSSGGANNGIFRAFSGQPQRLEPKDASQRSK